MHLESNLLKYFHQNKITRLMVTIKKIIYNYNSLASQRLYKKTSKMNKILLK